MHMLTEESIFLHRVDVAKQNIKVNVNVF